MKTRILSGLAMVPVLIIFYFGGYVMLAGCFLITLMALYEFYSGFKAMGFKPFYAAGFISATDLYLIGLFKANPELYLFWILVSVLMCTFYLFKIEERKLEDAMCSITGIFYVSFFAYHIVLVDQTGEYRLLVWLVIFSAFGSDIFAYFTGFLLGRHKLCPAISPKKTVEGAIGGVLGSVLICGIFGWVVIPGIAVHCLIIGALGAVFSQLGDLTASIFKRKMGIKDYGNLIPGHGGVMDRIDSILFTAPLVYYYTVLVITAA